MQACGTLLFQYVRHCKHYQGWTCFREGNVKQYAVTHITKNVLTHVKHSDEYWNKITRLALNQKATPYDMMSC